MAPPLGVWYASVMSLEVVVAPDRLSATLKWDLVQPAPTVAEVEEALRAAEITTWRADGVSKACQLMAAGAAPDGVVVASGVPPVEPVDGRIEWLFDPEADKPKAGKREEGRADRVDFREVRQFLEIEVGTLLARWHPPKQGVPGKDVTGAAVSPLDAKPPQDNKIQPGKGVVLSDDQTECSASERGHVFAMGTKISVDRLLQIRGNVDYRTGNIRYPGNVEISGDVMPDFVVEAEGNIVIAGVIEHAEVRADGDFIGKAGAVKGSRVIAKGSVQIRFAQDSYLECGGTIEVQDGLVQCVVGGCTKLDVTARAPRKGIVGGMIHSLGDVTAYTYGSEQAVVTIVAVGSDAEVLLKRGRLQAQVQQAESQLEQLRGLSKLAKPDPKKKPAPKPAAGGPLGGGPEKILAAIKEQEASLARATRELKLIQDPQGRPIKARIRVAGIAYENTEVQFGPRKERLKHPIQNAQFRYDADKDIIESAPLNS